MFAVCVTFEIEPSVREDFIARVRRQAEDSLAREPACRRFDVFTDTDRPDRVFLYELYDDRDAFARHLETPHFQAFDAATRAMLRDKTVVTWNLMLEPTR